MVVVLGVSETGLSAMRLLGRRGVRCWAVDARFDHPGFSSRYCERRICLSDGISAEELEEVLLEIAATLPQRAVLLPTSDTFVRLLRALRPRLAAHFDMALPPGHVIDDLLDKGRFAACAERTGLRVPRTATLLGTFHPAEAARQIGYPLLVKPRASDRRPPRLPKAVIVNDDAEAASFETLYPGLSGREIVAQEYVPGDDVRHISVAVALDSASRPLATFVARKRRQGNHGAGVGTFVESFRDDEAAWIAKRFLQQIGYVGVAEVELKRHAHTGELFTIEVNPRLWSQVMLPAALGLDFALLAYRVARGSTPANEVVVRERPIAWQDFWGDSYWTFRPSGYFWRGEISAPRWLAQTLTSGVHPFFEWHDPVPALLRMWQGAAEVATRASRLLPR